MKAVQMPFRTLLSVFLLGLLAFAMGCEKKEKVLDIETSRGNLTIERSTETGKVNVEVNRDKPEVPK